MLIKIVDINSKEYFYDLDDNLFTYFFSWINNGEIQNCWLNLGNKTELDLNSKINFFNIFNEIKNIKNILKLTILKYETILFDSELYNLKYKNIEYRNEYGSLSPNNIQENLEQYKIIITFDEGTE